MAQRGTKPTMTAPWALTLGVERLLLLSVQWHNGRRCLDASFVPQQKQETKDGSVRKHMEAFNTRLQSWVPVALERRLPQKRETLRSAQGNQQGERGKRPLLWHSIQHTVGLRIPPASGTSSSALLGLFPGVLLSPLQIPFPSACCPFPSAHSTYFASWMRTMMVHRPISPHTLAVPISAKTSTHSSTLSQVSSFCWGSDCKTQRGGEGQDAGSAWELSGTEAQHSLAGLSEISTGWPWKPQPHQQKAAPPLRPEPTQRPTSLPPGRGRPRHYSITQGCCPRNRENITAVSWIALYSN